MTTVTYFQFFNLRANLLPGVSKVMCLFCNMMVYRLSQRPPVTGTVFALASALQWQQDTVVLVLLQKILFLGFTWSCEI